MRLTSADRRWLWALALAALIVVTLLAGAAVYLAVQYRDAADYPGAVLVAGQTLYRLTPWLTIRRDTSYRTADPFPVVYNFYSGGFGLGPEVYAQSNCILMAQATTQLRFIEREMSVTVCDTPNGRLIFVMRSLALHYR